MARHSTSVMIYRRNIASQFQRAGQGYRWLDRVRRSMHNACERAAPSRTSELRRSHYSYIRGLNQYAAIAEITNTAEHAEWVHNGTVGPILPRKTIPGKLWVPASRGSAKRVLRPYVAGQKANPWMDQACSRIAMSRGAVPVG